MKILKISCYINGDLYPTTYTVSNYYMHGGTHGVRIAEHKLNYQYNNLYTKVRLSLKSSIFALSDYIKRGELRYNGN